MKCSRLFGLSEHAQISNISSRLCHFFSFAISSFLCTFSPNRHQHNPCFAISVPRVTTPLAWWWSFDGSQNSFFQVFFLNRKRLRNTGLAGARCALRSNRNLCKLIARRILKLAPTSNYWLMSGDKSLSDDFFISEAWSLNKFICSLDVIQLSNTQYCRRASASCSLFLLPPIGGSIAITLRKETRRTPLAGHLMRDKKYFVLTGCKRVSPGGTLRVWQRWHS